MRDRWGYGIDEGSLIRENLASNSCHLLRSSLQIRGMQICNAEKVNRSIDDAD